MAASASPPTQKEASVLQENVDVRSIPVRKGMTNQNNPAQTLLARNF